MIRHVLAALLLFATTLASQAQGYPSRPIRVISPFPPGGGTDLVARLVSQNLADLNKWSVFVENKPGASGAIGLAEAARANPAGYDLVIGQMDNLALSPFLSRVSFDSIKDFTPIALIGKTPIVFIVRRDSAFRGFIDTVEAVKAAPGSVTMGSPGSGSTTHLILELLRVREDRVFRHVPYRGAAPSLTDLLGGHVDVVGSSIASAMALIRSGEVRALAVTSTRRNPSLPEVPTLDELGIKAIDVSTWYGLLGPAGLPEEVTRTLNADVNRIVQRPEVIAALGEQGLEAAPMSREDFAALLGRDHASWGKIIGELGFKRE